LAARRWLTPSPGRLKKYRDCRFFQQVDCFIAWNFFQDLRFLKSDEESQF
jgi:hypothetical protein